MPDSKWTYPDGSSVTDHEDGSFTVTESNGSKTRYDPATGRRTETPAPGTGGQPTTTEARKNENDGAEIKITYSDGTRVYIRLNPRRLRVVRSLPLRPRKWEVEMPTGTRNVQEVENGEIVTTAPTTPEADRIEPSEHPAPPPEGGKKKSKKKVRTSKARKPKRRTSKKHGRK